MLAGEVPLFALQPDNGNRTLALDKPDHRGHCVFRWNRNAEVHVIRHRMTLNDLALFLTCQFVKDRTEFFPNVAKQLLASSFGHKYEVVFAIPLRVGQALIILVDKVLLWLRLTKPPRENLLLERSKLFKSHQ